MTSVEQHQMVQRLKSVTMKMSAEEQQVFEMISKRDRDDEDLDTMTITKLKKLYTVYFPKRTKQEIEDAWNKLSHKSL